MCLRCVQFYHQYKKSYRNRHGAYLADVRWLFYVDADHAQRTLPLSNNLAFQKVFRLRLGHQFLQGYNDPSILD